MTKNRSALCALAALGLLAGCADGYGEHYRGYGAVGVGYNGYYDDYYGPYYGGTWQNDGYFYYRDRDGRPHRDDQRHFRRDQAPGYHGVRDRGDRQDHRGPDGGRGDHDRDHR